MKKKFAGVLEQAIEKTASDMKIPSAKIALMYFVADYPEHEQVKKKVDHYYSHNA